MKIDIHDLFDGWEERELTLAPKRAVRAKAILRRTTEKIERKPRRQGRLVRRIVLAAAACLALAGSALAVVQYRAAKLETIDSYPVSNQETSYTLDADTVLTFAPQEPVQEEERHLFAVKATYLPGELKEGESSSLRETVEYMSEVTGEDLLSVHPLDEDLLDTAYTHICTYEHPENGDRKIVNVTVYSTGQIENKDFVMIGENTLEQEGTLCGMEAMWLTQEFGEGVSRNLILYNAATDCVIHIGGSSEYGDMDFATLEQIAEGLEIIDTGIPSTDVNPEWNWNMISVARG